ncbi:MAG TPA: Smr/MutS family protein [Geminicoccaceae bacterium]|nr:Smr/MutS family protein [Geminicoccaceae bacterium]
MSRQRRPSATELALWHRVMADAAPLREQSRPAPAMAPSGQPAPARPRERVVPRPRGRALDPERPVDLDRRTWLRLKRGQVELEQTLDLHGQTQDQAHRRLRAFVAEAQAGGRRCVLVVTGKGLETGGTLRHMVPRWLNEEPNRARVLAYAPAQPRHGGSGALYVLLRRRRDGH